MSTNQSHPAAPGIVVGRDIINSIIVTGDHNQFFIGDYKRLQEVYIEPKEIFKQLARDGFAGRDWLLDAIDQFTRSKTHGYIVLEAPAGMGKTTFLAWLARERGYVHHFAQLTRDNDKIGAGLRNLAAQLILAYQLDPFISEGVLPGAADQPYYLYNLLEQATQQLQPGERIMLVIDSIEEAGVPGPSQNALGLPTTLPEGVYILVSKRPSPVILNTGTTPRRNLALNPTDPNNKTDIANFLRQAAARPGIAQSLGESGLPLDHFIDILAAKSQGLWLYLHFVLDEIEQGKRSTYDLHTLPNNLIGYYAEWWKHWRQKDIDKWSNTYLPVLATLAAAREPLDIEHLRSWSNVAASSTSLEDMLGQEWAHFIAAVRRGQNNHYQFYHAILRELFEEPDASQRLQEQSLTRDSQNLLQAFRGACRKAHESILNALCNDLANAPDESSRHDAAFRLIRMDWLRHRYGIAADDIERQLDTIGRYVDTHMQRRYLIKSIYYALGASSSDRQRARLFMYRAVLNAQLGKLRKAELDYAAAEQLNQQATASTPSTPDDNRLAARIYLGRANIHSIRAEHAGKGTPEYDQELDHALRFYERAVDAARAFGQDPLLEIAIQKEQIYTHTLLEQWQPAEHLYKDTLGFLRRIRRTLEPTAYTRLHAQLLEVASQLHFNHALAAIEQSVKHVAEESVRQAQIELARGQLYRACTLAEEGIKLLEGEFDRTGDQELVYDLVLAYINKGDYLQAIDKHFGSADAPADKVRAAWNQALEQAQAYGILDLVGEAKRRLDLS